MKYLLVFFNVYCVFLVFGQSYQPFVGTLLYEITNLERPNAQAVEMRVISLDSLVRIESPSVVFGNQIFLKHLNKKKSILLISLSESANFAIKGDFEGKDTVITEKKYVWKKKFGSKKIADLNCKKLKLTFLKSEKTLNCYYSKTYSSKYLDAYNDFPGLPVEYYLETEDGILKYSLKSIDFSVPNYDLFGVPSNYQKVTFDEFVDIITDQQR